MRRQAGNGRRQRRYTGGDTHSGRQDVIDHQRRGGQQACLFAQILAGHRIRAAAVRICLNRLTIAEEHDRQQDQDRRNDRDDEVDPIESQRDQQRHRRFRSVCRARQRIEPEDRDSCRYADVLGSLFTGCQGFTK